jgi:hypothetical protein
VGNSEEPRLNYGAIFKHCLIVVKGKVWILICEIEMSLFPISPPLDGAAALEQPIYPSLPVLALQEIIS